VLPARRRPLRGVLLMNFRANRTMRAYRKIRAYHPMLG
jgi:hypothetical protein